MNQKSNTPIYYQGILALVFVALCWGLLPLFPRYLNTSFELFQQIYLRLGLGVIISFILFGKKIDFAKFSKITKTEWLLLVLRGILYYTVGVGFYTWALLLTKISNVMFIGAIPIYAVLGAVLFKEKLNIPKVILLALSFAGIVIVSVRDFSNIFNWGLGEMAALASGVSISLSLAARKWHSDLLSNQEMSLIILVVAFFSSLATSFLMGEGVPVISADFRLFFILFLAAFLNAGLIYFINFGYKHTPVILAGNILTLEVVFAIVLAYVFFGEVPVVREALGGLLIIASAIGMNIISAKIK